MSAAPRTPHWTPRSLAALSLPRRQTLRVVTLSSVRTCWGMTMCSTASAKQSTSDRGRILHGDDLKGQISGFVDEVLTTIIDARVSEGHAEDWDFDELWDALKQVYPISITVDDLAEDAGDRTKITRDQIVKEVWGTHTPSTMSVKRASAKRACVKLNAASCCPSLVRAGPSTCNEMEYLKEGIGLRATA